MDHPPTSFHLLDVEIDLDNNGSVDARVVNTTAGNLNGNDITDDSLSNDFLVSAVMTTGGTNWIEGGTLNVLILDLETPHSFTTAFSSIPSPPPRWAWAGAKPPSVTE